VSIRLGSKLLISLDYSGCLRLLSSSPVWKGLNKTNVSGYFSEIYVVAEVAIIHKKFEPKILAIN
jgi:hypothetical protein